MIALRSGACDIVASANEKKGCDLSKPDVLHGNI